jgi:GNAT superfamily N-acetyltransferase
MRELLRLFDVIWPACDGPRSERAEFFQSKMAVEQRELFALRQGERLISTAMCFPREIMSERGPLRVLALASVCTDPEFRGLGLGRRMVQAVFAKVDQGAYPVCLFQTGVPDFYLKQGARLIENRIINSLHQAGDRGSAEHPFWEPYAMVYPTGAYWPRGTIDLLGPGF